MTRVFRDLVRAYARARPRFSAPAPLLVWGGSPGEWEGEHPHTVAEREGSEGVFFSGWRGHDELPLGLACADLFIGPSVDEPFGQVFLEAMSCGVPVIATRSGGPPSFVNTGAREAERLARPPRRRRRAGRCPRGGSQQPGGAARARRERL